METIQKFGGDWTKTKLDMFNDYLNAYLIALSKQQFGTIYIDAFAGSGQIELEYEVLEGSARRALSAPRQFDYYYFIDSDPMNVESLKEMIHTEFTYLERRTCVKKGDANIEVKKIISSINWKTNRCLMFIDPYATQFEWESLSEIAKTEAIDLWYLFPCGAVNRLLTRSGEMEKSWEAKLDKVFGARDWRDAFYVESPQHSLFDDSECELIKDSSIEKMSDYLVEKLGNIFPGVSKKPYIFRNSTNAPLFLFCFAMSNPSSSAQKLALRIANYILNSKA